MRTGILVPLLCCALCELAACSVTVQQLPSWSGTAGQLESGNGLVTFLHTHEGATVALDVRIPESEFQGSIDAGSSSFDIWEECDNLAPGQKPDALSGGCTGFAYTVPDSSRGLRKEGGTYSLRGSFRVEPAGGPVQGLMLVKLVPAGAAK